MFKNRGLAFNIFIFTSFLLILVVTIVMGLLYFILPSYYLSQKEQGLERSSNELTNRLQTLTTEEECASLISEFAGENNVIVSAYNAEGSFLPQLSSAVYYTVTSSAVKETYHGPDETGEAVIHSINISEVSGTSENPAPETYIEVSGEKPMTVRDDITSATSYASYNPRSSPVSNIGFMVYPKNNFIDYMIINMTLQPIDEAKTVIISLVPWLLLLAFIISLIAAWLFANQLTKPILQISGAAGKMQSRQPNILSNVRSNDELGQLSRNMDGLYVSLCQNIQELQNEMEKVSKLEQSKTDFMRAAGHELKTPIATLNGMIEGMIDNVGSYKNREKYLRECKQQISRLARLVNEILLSSQLEAAKDTMRYEDADVSSLIDETIISYEVLLKEKQLRLTKESFDFIFESDAHLLRQIFSNLISNAVNYTKPGGEILISFSRDGRGSVLSFENQCEEIEETELTNLFEPFYTRSYSRDKTKSGTGLGLYITKKNLEALNLSYKVSVTGKFSPSGFKFDIIF